MIRRSIWIPAVTALSLMTLTSPVAADSWFNFGRHIERGSGDIITEDRETKQFERIRLECSADLVISVGEALRVTVTTDDNLMDRIITEVVGRRTLVIDSEGSYRTRHGVLVEISVPDLRMIEVDGSGNVEIANLDTETFEVILDGSGDIELEGRIKELEISVDGSGNVSADELLSEIVFVELQGSGDIDLRGEASIVEMTVQGSGDIDARRLKADEVTVRIYGSGDVKVFAAESFDGAVYGSGDIDVYGDPKDLERHVSGSGGINRH